MKIIIITIVLTIMMPGLSISGSKFCPNIEDFKCLIENSEAVYYGDFGNWWKIYHYTANRAKKCTDHKIVTLLFGLWFTKVDGETAEGLSSDSEEILIKNYECFFEGVLGLSENQRESFCYKFWPLGPDEPVKASLIKAMKNPRYEPFAKIILHKLKNRSW